jgi:hypothetical protein
MRARLCPGAGVAADAPRWEGAHYENKQMVHRHPLEFVRRVLIDFNAGSLGATTLAPNTSTTFTVTSAPSAAGSRTAAIHIASNDADENPFDITLAGSGLTRLEGWRLR